MDRFLVRSHRRSPVCYSVTFRSTDGLIKGKGLVVEMSASGVMILGEGPAVETFLQLEILDKKCGSSIRIERAKVQWVRDGVFGAKIKQADPHELLHWNQRIKTLATTR